MSDEKLKSDIKALYKKARSGTKEDKLKLLEYPILVTKGLGENQTLLNELAWNVWETPDNLELIQKILDHPLVAEAVAYDGQGNTPLHDLITQGYLTKEMIEKRFPWFNVGKKEIDYKLASEIRYTPNTLKFMIEDS